MELSGTIAPLSPHLVRKPFMNYSKVKRRVSPKISKISKINQSLIREATNSVSPKSTASKIYNPATDRLKIVDGDLFEFKGRIGLADNTSPTNDKSALKEEHLKQLTESQTITYSYPEKVLR